MMQDAAALKGREQQSSSNSSSSNTTTVLILLHCNTCVYKGYMMQLVTRQSMRPYMSSFEGLHQQRRHAAG
jgi:hypothetical protein